LDFALQFLDLAITQFPLGREQIQLQKVYLLQLQSLEPRPRRLGLYAFYGTLLMQVVLQQQPVQLIQRSRPTVSQSFAHGGKLSILGILCRRRPDFTHALNRLVFACAMPIQPEQLTQLIGVAPIGFVSIARFGLHEDDFPASVFVEHFQQPIVETTNLDDGHEAALICRRFNQVVKKLHDLIPLRADLSLEYDVSFFVTQIYCQLLAMKVDSKVQHELGLLCVKVVEENRLVPRKLGKGGQRT
jgi:hypothetical protein